MSRGRPFYVLSFSKQIPLSVTIFLKNTLHNFSQSINGADLTKPPFRKKALKISISDFDLNYSFRSYSTYESIVPS